MKPIDQLRSILCTDAEIAKQLNYYESKNNFEIQERHIRWYCKNKLIGFFNGGESIIIWKSNSSLPILSFSINNSIDFKDYNDKTIQKIVDYLNSVK